MTDLETYLLSLDPKTPVGEDPKFHKLVDSLPRKKLFGGSAPQSTLQLNDPNAERARGQISGLAPTGGASPEALQGLLSDARETGKPSWGAGAPTEVLKNPGPEPSAIEQRGLVDKMLQTIPIQGITTYHGSPTSGIPGAVEEAYRKMRDPKSKALLEKRYPELKAGSI